jgi:hypothetical protein
MARRQAGLPLGVPRERIRGARERDEERVALRVDLDAAVRSNASRRTRGARASSSA